MADGEGIQRSEIISDEAIRAPLELAENLDAASESYDHIITKTKELITVNDKEEQSITDVSNLLNQLSQQEQKLVDTQNKMSIEVRKLTEIQAKQKKEIEALTNQLKNKKKAQDAATASTQAFGNALNTVNPRIGGAIDGIKNFTKAALAFIATPVGLILAGIALGLAAVTSYFRSSEDAQNRWNKVAAVGNAIFEQFMNVVEAVGEFLVDAFTNPRQALIDFATFLKDNIVNRFEGLIELIPALGKAFQLLFKGEFVEAGKVALDAVVKVGTGIENVTDKIGTFIDETVALVETGVAYGLRLANLQAKLDRDERKLTTDRAKTNLEVAKLRQQAIELEGKERRKVLEEAIALEEDLTRRELEHAVLVRDIAALKLKANGDDKDAKKELADAEAKLFDVQRTAFENTFKFRKQVEALREEETKKRRKAIDDQVETERTAAGKSFEIARRHLANVVATNATAVNLQKSAWEDLIETMESVLDAFKSFSGAIGSLFSNITARRVQELDQEERANKEKLARDLERVKGNDVAEKKLKEDAAIRSAEIERKKREETRKTAIFEKGVALAEAGIQLSLAIIKSLTRPLALAATIALGAIQVAAIAAKPIPALFRGSRSFRGGPAIVGDRYGSELIVPPNGAPWLTPDRATLVDLPTGTQVIPHDETLAIVGSGGGSRDQFNAKGIIRAVNRIRIPDYVRMANDLYEARRSHDGSVAYIRKQIFG